MPEAVIVAAARTPIGRARKGSLATMRADDLGAIAVAEAVRRVPGLAPESIEDVILGCAVPEGQQGFGIARTVGLLAGLPNTVPGLTVSRACASSLQAIRSAAHAVVAGEGDTFVAGGVESVSQVPVPSGYDDLNARFTDPSRDDYVADLFQSMLQTAENVARRHDISRGRMDEFAALSQSRAVAAQESGFFDPEIAPVTLPDGTVVTRDDGPRADTTVESLARLSPVMGPEGRVTAGNACPLNDGAAAVVVMSDIRARELGLTPLARIVASAVSGLEPEYMGVGPIEAVRKVLDWTGMAITDIDIVELNEAFAAQVLAVTDALGIDVADQLNPHGGAIALGHPFGMTGARIMTTLLNGLKARDQHLGIETMCIGGGMGMAMLVERLS
ncbi:acetyl-CoA C-acyltransferase [Aeromicrobium sp. 636]|uniref:Acetyl-CoA C-acyltransferase n=1 Tax=Aeromicrobium senzhongii TaxID=2663859 RepID=A0A8I0EXM0_9ACTN|nr:MULTISPECIES: acetyl-CoA C-acyltransferase [Aeromicrobium]MBC9227494.1 acetyl-CoA C-acyltransferase [Aeromicrobium senzhongii]MCQ3999591.1 acetyl-CoA C-acyltransferase [Aeromicrobium sp. 636]